jgi:biotin-dependent carboxylase-like uncharacterized protein
MPTFFAIDPGLLTTVQDLGRFGAQRLGIPISGAMDRPSLILANRLVGNDPGAAGLEASLRGPDLHVIEETCVAITGATAMPRLNGRPLPMWTAIRVRRGDRLSMGAAERGCRLYLGVAGGIDVPIVLGSRSTYLSGRLGGLEGRALKKGDLLFTGSPRLPLEIFAGQRVDPPKAVVSGEITLRVVLGPQDDSFTPAGLQTFLNAPYQVTRIADRMGYRLSGPRIEHARGHDIISDATQPGSIQVAGDGQPIILLADRPTTGGYPKIATVLTVDCPLVAQARPGAWIRFQSVTVLEAHRLLRESASALANSIVKTPRS